MKIVITQAIRALLHDTAHDQALPQALRSTASTWVESESIPWGVLRGLCAALKESRQAEDGGPWVHELCQGGGVQLPAPPPRAKTMTPELREHLEQLRRKLEQDSYDAMVRDVTKHEREALEKRERGLRTYREQLRFGLHVIVMMGTFYALGHVLGLSISSNKLAPLVLGLVFMMGALVMETVLFVIRTNVPPTLEPPEEPEQQQQQQQQQQGGQATRSKQAPEAQRRKGQKALSSSSSSSSSRAAAVGSSGQAKQAESATSQAKPAEAKKVD